MAPNQVLRKGMTDLKLFDLSAAKADLILPGARTYLLTIFEDVWDVPGLASS